MTSAAISSDSGSAAPGDALGAGSRPRIAPSAARACGWIAWWARGRGRDAGGVVEVHARARAVGLDVARPGGEGAGDPQVGGSSAAGLAPDLEQLVARALEQAPEEVGLDAKWS